MIIHDKNEVAPRPFDPTLKVWQHVSNVATELDNAFRDWESHAWNPKNGVPCTADAINRVAVETKAQVWNLKDLPGFTATRRLVVTFCDNAKGGETKSEKELRRRAQCLCDAYAVLEIYRLAFVAGQDNPDA